MAASKLEMHISQFVHKIATKFQRLYLCFRGPAIQWKYWQCCTTQRGETGSGKSKMAAFKLEMHICQHVHKIATKFQRLCLRFRGPDIQCNQYGYRTMLVDAGNQIWRPSTGSGYEKRTTRLVDQIASKFQRLYPLEFRCYLVYPILWL
jgi:hypothetical protein